MILTRKAYEPPPRLEISGDLVVKYNKIMENVELKRVKIGSGYFRTGHNCNTKRKGSIYLIEGFLYAKDKSQSTRMYLGNKITELGYVPVNMMDDTFCQVSLHCDEHKSYGLQIFNNVLISRGFDRMSNREFINIVGENYELSKLHSMGTEYIKSERIKAQRKPVNT